MSIPFPFSKSIDAVISIELSLLKCLALFVFFWLDPNLYTSNKSVIYYLGVYYLMRISKNNLSNTHLGPRIPLDMDFYSERWPPRDANLESMAMSRSFENFVDAV